MKAALKMEPDSFINVQGNPSGRRAWPQRHWRAEVLSAHSLATVQHSLSFSHAHIPLRREQNPAWAFPGLPETSTVC